MPVALLASPLAFPAVSAAPHEINVFADALEEPGAVGLHLPGQRDREGKFHADGLRVRLKHMWPRKEPAALFTGINVEWGYDQPHLSEDRHSLELRGILGWRTERWLVAVNPILAWVVKGPNKSGTPDFDASLKFAREVREGWALGIEHYSRDQGSDRHSVQVTAAGRTSAAASCTTTASPSTLRRAVPTPAGTAHSRCRRCAICS